MFVKILKIGLVGSLLLILVGGAVYILGRPSEARAGYLERGDTDGLGRGGNQQGGELSERSATHGAGAGGFDYAVRGRSQENGVGVQDSARDAVRGQAGQGEGVGAASVGRGQGAQGEWNDAVEPEWQTIQGSVIEAGSELLVDADEGKILVGLGQEFYREEQGFEVNVGDEVVVQGYYEDGEFKAGSVENSTTGAQITLRDVYGRPMWSGRGNNKNQS